MNQQNEWEEEFDSWFNFLLMSCARAGKYGMDHPLGSCLMRDVIREPMVRAEMKRSYKKHVIDGDDGNE